jgi:septum formation protein
VLILASSSPRRAQLLRAAGLDFQVDAAEIDEDPLPGEPAGQYVLRVARDKAAVVARRKSGNLILAADTTVVVDEAILGKPSDDREARGMLERLSGRAHDVLTGVVLLDGNREFATVECTEVHFLRISPDEIDAYIASGEPRDKAGAYAIQGQASRFVRQLQGSYTNVVGLPIASVCGLLRQAGGL